MAIPVYPSDVTDAEWALLAPLLPPPKPRGRPRTVDLRCIVNGLFYVLRTGCAWRFGATPARYSVGRRCATASRSTSSTRPGGNSSVMPQTSCLRLATRLDSTCCPGAGSSSAPSSGWGANAA